MIFGGKIKAFALAGCCLLANATSEAGDTSREIKKDATSRFQFDIPYVQEIGKYNERCFLFDVIQDRVRVKNGSKYVFCVKIKLNKEYVEKRREKHLKVLQRSDVIASVGIENKSFWIESGESQEENGKNFYYVDKEAVQDHVASHKLNQGWSWFKGPIEVIMREIASKMDKDIERNPDSSTLTEKQLDLGGLPPLPASGLPSLSPITSMIMPEHEEKQAEPAPKSLDAALPKTPETEEPETPKTPETLKPVEDKPKNAAVPVSCAQTSQEKELRERAAKTCGKKNKKITKAKPQTFTPLAKDMANRLNKQYGHKWKPSSQPRSSVMASPEWKNHVSYAEAKKGSQGNMNFIYCFTQTVEGELKNAMYLATVRTTKSGKMMYTGPGRGEHKLVEKHKVTFHHITKCSFGSKKVILELEGDKTKELNMKFQAGQDAEVMEKNIRNHWFKNGYAEVLNSMKNCS